MASLTRERYLVYGLAVAGAAVVRALTRRGTRSSPPTTPSTDAERDAGRRSLGVELVDRPGAAELDALRRSPSSRGRRRRACRRRTPLFADRRPAPGGPCAARSSSPTAGSRSGPAGRGRCSR